MVVAEDDAEGAALAEDDAEELQAPASRTARSSAAYPAGRPGTAVFLLLIYPSLGLRPFYALLAGSLA